uniref:Sperm-tail PG-rich repeat-containing protein 2 n=1 Tax=Schistosoma mansoni TaxID=6183 RepID=A0A5K4FCE7_SCHMA
MCCAQTKLRHLQKGKGGENNNPIHHITFYTTPHIQYCGDYNLDTNVYRTSGFVSNIRPFIRYNGKLDEKDNPAFRNILSSNYLSTNHKDFLAYSIPSGKETLTYLAEQLVNETKVPKAFSTENNILDQKAKDILTPILPKEKFVLSRKAGSCNVENENYCHGPNTHPTTHVVRYGRIESRPYDMFKVTIGRKEESGSTRSISNFDAISNCFRYSFKTVQTGCKTDKLTSQTTYMSDFRPFCHKNGSESFSNWVGNISYQKPNGYVIQNKLSPEYKSHHSYYIFKHSDGFPEVYLEKLMRTDSDECQSAIHGFIEPSITKSSQNGLQNQPKSPAELLGRVTVGRLETSGSALNISGYVKSQDTPPDRCVSHSMNQFCYPPLGQEDGDRGHILFNIQPPKETATSRSVRLHYLEPQTPSTDKLGTYNPYQSKSISARDTLLNRTTKNII